ncbi:hypothetical protein V1517DRAFT_316155 [Lipomyces orientalis]|uniref:Uncharacterized protein n=1 Tax=Lipomyces orientalis TaxID=1233043 RepID=A0ACC3TUT0_9ASCO
MFLFTRNGDGLTKREKRYITQSSFSPSSESVTGSLVLTAYTSAELIHHFRVTDVRLVISMPECLDSHAVWREALLFKLPTTLRDEDAAPLMCTGSTVFDAL